MFVVCNVTAIRKNNIKTSNCSHSPQKIHPYFYGVCATTVKDGDRFSEDQHLLVALETPSGITRNNVVRMRMESIHHNNNKVILKTVRRAYTMRVADEKRDYRLDS